ncbi:MAG: SRPBCC domain-containing protein [Bauldia sp.]
MSELPNYVLERRLAAPPALVWRTWTEPGLVSRWYGPNVETIVHRLDLRPGGLWLIEMRWGGRSNYQRAEYTEVSAPGRLVWLHSNADADWQVSANPRMPDWPRVMLTEVTLAADGAGTRLRLTWKPHRASQAEIACFAGAIAQMGGGWEAGMQLLEQLLAELQAGGK